MVFIEELKKYQDIIEEELKKYIVDVECPEKKLYEASEYSLLAGGKRLRPILILATYRLFKEDYQVCMPYCVAMEMIHNFSLIHDDLPGIDNDDFRHGKPTNHRQFGESTAILAGDRLLNYAYILMSIDISRAQSQEEILQKLRAMQEISFATDRMIAGEFVDTEFEGKPISERYLSYMHKNKTGALIRACVRSGAILAKASEKEIIDLTNYAENIGLAFQIKDDILSEEGDESVTGKPVGNDREKNKCTYVTKYGLEESKQRLDKLINDATKIMEKYGEKGEFLKKLAIYIKERNK